MGVVAASKVGSASIVRERTVRKQDVGKAEAREIPHAHRVEDAVQMVAFVLDHAGVKAVHGPVDRGAARVGPLVAQAAVTRDHAPQALSTA